MPLYSVSERNSVNRELFYLKRYLFATLRYALLSGACGVFFKVGLEIGSRVSDEMGHCPKLTCPKNELRLEDSIRNRNRNRNPRSLLLNDFESDDNIDEDDDDEREIGWSDSNNQMGHFFIPKPNLGQPGEMGKPVLVPSKLTEHQQKLVEDGMKNNGFNQYVSDLISVERSLPDLRNPRCKDPGRYLPTLPPTSVVIIFHNEAWTVLLRSVHSILNRSPPELIKEIILVDDNSTMSHLKDQLETYMLRFSKVRIIRSAVRLGLIRARIMGANAAKGKIITFLDAHIEVTPGWLPPLLDRIARNFTTVVVPHIHVLCCYTLELLYDKNPPGPEFEERTIGVFEWNLDFNWEAISEREKRKHNCTTEPYASPTMAGGLFAISKRFWEYLGKYDDGLEIWGGENIEISFKTWMCGGRLESVPCSHVGHIYRKSSAYKIPNVPYRNNVIRVAKVWMDDYIKYFYSRFGIKNSSDLGDYGDISERIALRKRLKCKPFRWFLENVYPEVFIPDSGYAYGEIRNLGFGGKTCLDSVMSRNNDHKPVKLFPCHGGGGNQKFSLTRIFEIRRGTYCVDYPSGQYIMITGCHGCGTKGNQAWIYENHTKLLKHSITQLCMTMTSTFNLTMAACDKNSQGQHWQFESYKTNLSTDPFKISI